MDTGNHRTDNRPPIKSGDYPWDRPADPILRSSGSNRYSGSFDMIHPPQFLPRLSPHSDGHSFPGGYDYFPLWLQQRPS